uniref:Uncharacterized protein n=1 Tax=Anguilla anguilla TaxID=7936 RepID=A0A0E9QG48_ANGAN
MFLQITSSDCDISIRIFS